MFEPFERANGVGKWNFPIRPVDQIEIYVVSAKFRQAAFTRRLNLLGPQVTVGYFACDDHVGTPAFQGLSKYALRPAVSVSFSCVNEVDTVVERGVNGGNRVFIPLISPNVVARERPSPQGEFRDFDAGSSEFPVFHYAAPMTIFDRFSMLNGLAGGHRFIQVTRRWS